MIKIGNTEVQYIKVGVNNVPVAIKVEQEVVWPVDFFYTLVFYSRSYSSSTNKVHATGSDYCEFSCKYSKYRTSDSGLVEETIVVAEPSTIYFKSVNNKLYYDYDNYKATVVSSGVTNVQLTYGGLSVMTTFDFAGNTYTESSTISQVVITGIGSTSINPVYASGATLTYTGGIVTNYLHWTSGYIQTIGTQNAAFHTAQNSRDSRFTGAVAHEPQVIVIPSLAAIIVDAGYYTFDSYTYNGQSTSFTIFQENNYLASTTNSFDFYDASNNTKIDGRYDVSSSAGTMSFYVERTHTDTYRSGAKQEGTTTVANTNMGVLYQTGIGGGLIISTGISGTYNVLVNYSQNTTQYQKVDIVIAENIDGTTYSKNFSILQAAAGEDIYSLSTSVSSLRLASSGGTTQFTITSTKNGEPLVPAVGINPNNIGGTINLGGSGPYTAILGYTTNSSLTEDRTATINITQGASGLSKTISVTQYSAGNDPFYGINIKGTSGKWAIGTLKTGETTIPGVGTLDVACIMVVCEEPIVANTIISISHIAIQQMTTTTNYYSISQVITTGSTITMTPYNGNSHTYYGALLSFEYEGTTKTFSTYPGTQINMMSGFSVS